MRTYWGILLQLYKWYASKWNAWYCRFCITMIISALVLVTLAYKTIKIRIIITKSYTVFEYYNYVAGRSSGAWTLPIECVIQYFPVIFYRATREFSEAWRRWSPCITRERVDVAERSVWLASPVKCVIQHFPVIFYRATREFSEAWRRWSPCITRERVDVAERSVWLASPVKCVIQHFPVIFYRSTREFSGAWRCWSPYVIRSVSTWQNVASGWRLTNRWIEMDQWERRNLDEKRHGISYKGRSIRGSQHNHQSPRSKRSSPAKPLVKPPLRSTLLARLTCRGENHSSPQAVEQAPPSSPLPWREAAVAPSRGASTPVVSPAVERSCRRPKPWSKHPRRLPCRGEKPSSPPSRGASEPVHHPALSEAESHSHPNVSNMYVPVTPMLHQEWLRLRAELTIAIDDAVEQGARLREAMDVMQQVLEAHSTLEELQAAREELDWAERWRDQTLEYACYVERKLELVQAMDCMVEACRHF